MAVPQANRSGDLTPEQWTQVEAVFHAAVDREGGSRAAYLDDACRTDPQLRLKIEALLAVEQAACGFLASVTVAAMDSLEISSFFPQADSTGFPSDERFLLRGELGRGGFGIVYEAYDRKQNAIIALKTLRHVDASALHRFKQEFRSLADIYHPNLVTLYELISNGEEWFFTMELVHGRSFLEFAADCGFSRLRSVLTQLVEGVSALHQSLKLHCDLKPSNVLVTPDGRVVILDFGLVTEIASGATSQPGIVFGTPLYMAPEQMLGVRSEAADWYSVGVMLYEAITGRPPFSGRNDELLEQKRRIDPPQPAELVRGLPADLSTLCRDLLCPNPERRPSGHEILRRLGSPVSRPPDHLFFGRAKELEALRAAFRGLEARGPVLQFVQGDSGIGKTALVRHFLDGLVRSDDVVVLEGRCYERESVPYKALDSFVDHLCEYLADLPRNEVEGLVPDHASALVKLFPALRRVISFRPETGGDLPEPHVLRFRAFGAIKELIRRLAAIRPVVCFIDDLQWGDADSGALLSEFLRPPDAPPVLFIACYRKEGATTGPFLEALLPLTQAPPIVVEELTAEEARELARSLIHGNRSEADADLLGRRSGGSPFLLHCLASYSQLELPALQTSGSDAPDIDEVVRSAVSRLPKEARRLLEVVSVAGRPIDLDVAQQASDLAQDVNHALAPLRGERLVRIRRSDERREIEPYHDRIRESIAKHLPAATVKSHHRSLALAWEASGVGEAETMAVHFLGAGEFGQAAHYATLAADKASEALAFDQASRLYRLALSLNPSGGEEHALRAKLGGALSNAGRGAEGAAEYLKAAGKTNDLEALELRRRAAVQYLCSGHLPEGEAVLRIVLATVGMKLASTPRRALLSLLWRRGRVKLRGLRFEKRHEADIPEEVLIRIDACWSVAHGLGMIDVLRAADFHASHLLFALRAGEPYRVARAFAVEAAYCAFGGSRSRPRTKDLIDRATELADACGHPHALGLVTLVSGMAAFLEGRWKVAQQILERAEIVLQERCVGVTWELATARIMGCASLYFMGRVVELSERLPNLLRDADTRGDLYEATALRTRIEHVTLVAADSPLLALEQLGLAMEKWPGREFQTQHWWALVSEAETLLYSGQPGRALDLWTRNWERIRRSHVLRLQYIRIETHHQRAACALGAGHQASLAGRSAFLKLAESDAAAIAKENVPWGNAIVTLIRASAAAGRKRAEEAMELLTSAEESFKIADMALFAVVIRRRRGELLGGDEGGELVRSADVWMAAQKIKCPERMASMIAPGNWQIRR